MRLDIEVQSARMPETRDSDREKMAGAGRYVCQIELCALQLRRGHRARADARP